MLYEAGWRILATALIGTLLLAEQPARSQDMSQSPFAKRQKVQPFPEGMEWINTSRPIELSELRGKFVLLDFWTYCCINCMHVLPELKKLEKAYPNELVVIGVHSAKFDGEKETENIAEAVLRYEVEHPVANDSDMVLWKRFGVQSWPSLLLIDPQGYAVWGASGETTFESLDAVMKKAVPFYRKQKLLRAGRIDFGKKPAQAASTPLRFPGKVLADEPGNRLFIADSNHNRIVVARLDGALLETIGEGAIGRADGPFESARFHHPQGMALDGETLYVADTENHLLRKVDLAARRVTTIAGTGSQRRTTPPFGAMEVARRSAMSSPWALWIHENDLFVAMAGPHQIWRMRLDKGGKIGVHAGNGREDIVDGPMAPRRPYELGYASFAQPSGLASDGKRLFVADSEGSSIRSVPLARGVEVETVVGTADLPGARLFTFGDVDGPRERVRMQHPLGIVYYRKTLYVADTYNNKVKQVDPASGQTRTIAGSSRVNGGETEPLFDEPAGIAAAAGRLFVADTNNHRIAVIDLDNENSVSTLTIPGLKPPVAPRAGTEPRDVAE